MSKIWVTCFIRPNGRKEYVEIPNVYEDDAKYITKNNIKVSIEDIGGTYCVWLDDGKKNDDNEPDEILVLSGNRNCQDTIKEGVELLKVRKNENSSSTAV